MKLTILYNSFLIVAILLLMDVSFAAPERERFVLHILPGTFHSLSLGYDAERSWSILKNIDLSSGAFRITVSDIESYDSNRQIFVLSKKISERLLQDLEIKKGRLLQDKILKDPQFPPIHLLNLEAFVISLDEKQVFGGIFINPFSAMAIDYAEKIHKIFGDSGKLKKTDGRCAINAL